MVGGELRLLDLGDWVCAVKDVADGEVCVGCEVVFEEDEEEDADVDVDEGEGMKPMSFFILVLRPPPDSLFCELLALDIGGDRRLSLLLLI